MRTLRRTLAWSGLALALAGATTAVVAQNRGEPDPGTLAGLTAEVRELRLAVQQLSQTQAQTQALGVYLSVQQSRVLQASAQLDAARKELDAATSRINLLGTQLADLEEQLPRTADATERNALQGAVREMRREHALVSAQEQQARNREIELSQSLQAEESRWSALISRLESISTQR